MAETDDTGPAHPEVVRRAVYGSVWPVGTPFQLTPLEAWYVLQGWAVKPAGGIGVEQVVAMPGKIEGGNNWVWLWQA